MSSTLTCAAIALFLCFNGILAVEPVDWWESAVYYQIYPRSFMDSDGDGVGDLNGVTSRLKYLKEIGVTAAWLSPIYQSPMVDVGYDISNFKNIDPLFGTLDDFDRMIKTAHKLGLKIIIDFVPNHSSDKHEWFQKSIRREDGYDDLYMWDDGKIDPVTGERIPPSNWESMFGGSAWTWVEERQQYYFHHFYSKQPDFNMTNPYLRKQLIGILEFWLDRGVDAFRIDAISFFIEKRFENGTYVDNLPNTYSSQLDQPESLELLYEWREFMDKYKREHGGDTRALIGEAYAPIDALRDSTRAGSRNGLHMPMNLQFPRVNDSTMSPKFIEERANAWMDVIWKAYRVVNWVIGNHDNGRVGTLKGFTRVDLLNMLLHALPGPSITYYGEEIGMTDGEINCTGFCDFRNPERTPMQWDTTKNAGFSAGNFTWLPINPNYEFINVETQRRQDRSSLKIFKEMVELKKTPAFRAFKEDGAFAYAALNDQVFHVMRTDKATEEYRILANFGNNLEHVDGLTNKTMEYVVLNSYSPHKKGDKVDLSKRIYLMPSECVVLRWPALSTKKMKSKKFN